MKLLWVAAGAAVGYVLGTKAGRERYEQIRATAHGVFSRSTVSDGVDPVTAPTDPTAVTGTGKAAETGSRTGVTATDTPVKRAGTERPPDTTAEA